jgi:hypothetical protein
LDRIASRWSSHWQRNFGGPHWCGGGLWRLMWYAFVCIWMWRMNYVIMNLNYIGASERRGAGIQVEAASQNNYP